LIANVRDALDRCRDEEPDLITEQARGDAESARAEINGPFEGRAGPSRPRD
jgi:hypothetical protein